MSPWQEIVINGQIWTLGRSLGSGGFGEVCAAESRGQWAAIKLVPKDYGARRELLFADDLRGATNVLPVWGIGETKDSWALLMPKAEQTLHQYLGGAGGSLHEDEALPILIDVARALVSLTDTGVVHRDLKPDNVLFYQGTWCLTDFGISRYADAVTEKDTRKYSTTRPYAAPEQWRDETATAATDVYALGVMSHELLTGSLPFPGSDFRHQHLHKDPPVIENVAPHLAALVEECLFKAPGARPTTQNLLSRLERQMAASPTTRGIAALQEANLTAASRLSRQGRRESEARSERERTGALLVAARRQFERISAELEAAILTAAPTARPSRVEMPGWQLTLTNSGICLTGMDMPPAEDSERIGSNYQGPMDLPFDVLSCAAIAVAGRRNNRGHVGRAHSLWYCDAEESGRYGWYETAFIDETRPANDDRLSTNYFRDMGSTFGLYIPYSAHALEPRAAQALNPRDSGCLVAWPFTRLEFGSLDEFIDRWANWLAEASRGALQEPSPRQAARLRRSWRKEDPQRSRSASESRLPDTWQDEEDIDLESKPRRRGVAGVLGRLVDSIKGSPPDESSWPVSPGAAPPADAGIFLPTRPAFIPTDPEPTAEQRYALAHGSDRREIDRQLAGFPDPSFVALPEVPPDIMPSRQFRGPYAAAESQDAAKVPPETKVTQELPVVPEVPPLREDEEPERL